MVRQKPRDVSLLMQAKEPHGSCVINEVVTWVSAPTKRTSAAPCHRVLSVLRAGVNDSGEDSTMKASRALDCVAFQHHVGSGSVMRVAKTHGHLHLHNKRQVGFHRTSSSQGEASKPPSPTRIKNGKHYPLAVGYAVLLEGAIVFFGNSSALRL